MKPFAVLFFLGATFIPAADAQTPSWQPDVTVQQT